MNSNPTCRLCGQPIVFRMIQGCCIPMHPEGGCSGHRSETEDEKKRDCLYLTDCPKCGDPVYFLRHNGGSTWLDEIPYPWPKHACFLDDSAPVPPPWVGMRMENGRSILARIRLRPSGGTADLYPVDPKTRRWFDHLGGFRVVPEAGISDSSFDGQLVIVSVSDPDRRFTMKITATTGDGLTCRLIPAPASHR